MRTVSTVRELEEWARMALVGDRVIYFVGLLDKARASKLPMHDGLIAVANRAYELFVNGDLHLVQHRTGAAFEYIAVKRNNPWLK